MPRKQPVAMTRSLGYHSVQVKVVSCPISPCSHKIVLEDLEEQLGRRHITVRHVETREAGRDTPIALRVRLVHGSAVSFTASLNLQLIDYPGGQFNSKLVLNGLETALVARGVKIGHAETRANGRGTALALRLTV